MFLGYHKTQYVVFFISSVHNILPYLVHFVKYQYGYKTPLPGRASGQFTVSGIGPMRQSSHFPAPAPVLPISAGIFFF